MSKVLISIKPEWCELIANGKKTVEVRKTRPKIETPFKCYIYCTKDKNNHFWTGKRYSYADDHSHNAFDEDGNGKIIGEFICNRITSLKVDSATQAACNASHTCLTAEKIMQYANGGKLYYWRISNLKIYDKPREISKFYTKCDEGCEYCNLWKYIKVNKDEYDMECSSSFYGHKPLKRAPQSWCYVE